MQRLGSDNYLSRSRSITTQSGTVQMKIVAPSSLVSGEGKNSGVKRRSSDFSQDGMNKMEFPFEALQCPKQKRTETRIIVLSRCPRSLTKKLIRPQGAFRHTHIFNLCISRPRVVLGPTVRRVKL